MTQKSTNNQPAGGEQGAKRIALFQGSFDPFTRGHESIVRRALAIFDEVVVAVTRNSSKQGMFPLEQRLAIIKATFCDQPRVGVVVGEGLTIDVAREVGACCLLRGVRGAIDFEYETTIAEANRRFSGGLESVFLSTLPEYSHISSTVVREWLKYGKDVSEYMPENVSSEMLNIKK